MSKKLKILALFDINLPLDDFSKVSEFLKQESWRDERDVITALKKSGHEVLAFGVYDKIEPLFFYIQKEKPNLIFNMCEGLAHMRHFEAQLIAFIELLQIPYTGSGWNALNICKDKALSKQLLSVRNIRVPQFLKIDQTAKKNLLDDFIFPAIVKPLNLEASEGISQASIVKNPDEAWSRIAYLRDSLHSEAIVEEFISGREVYVGILGNQRLEVFPPIELFFKNCINIEDKIASYKVKWDKNHRKKLGVSTGPARKMKVPVLHELEVSAKIIYKTLGLKGYARLDFRINQSGEIYFLEANPNPSISRADDFAKAAKSAGYEYEDLIESIVALGRRAA